MQSRWVAIRTSFEIIRGGPPDQLTFGGGLLLGARWISRPALLASVAGSWQGGRRSGRHHPENPHPGCSWGGFYPAWRSPGGLEECRHHGEGRAELCGANNKRDTTPEGWLFLKLLFEGE